MTWDILMCSIPHRHKDLCALLEYLDGQMEPGVRVILHRDNMKVGYGDKCQLLLDAATAEYVSFFDDDDWCAPDFIRCMLQSMASRPDYVGFSVKYTVGGQLNVPIEHSLRYPGWHERYYGLGKIMLVRDIVHLNPIKCELARLGTWSDPGWQADFRWANQVRETGRVKTEVYVPDYMYYKRDPVQGGAFGSNGGPLPEDEILSLPRYPWLLSIGD